MNKRILLTCLGLMLLMSTSAQELKCQISVVAPSIQNTEKRIFETLQKSLQEFVNSRKWTNDVYSEEERIECSMLFNIVEKISNDRFKATLQVQSSRPGFKSNYNSVMLSVMDDKVEFNYLENDPLLFQENQSGNNLTSIVAFYAYLILGYDYESFAPSGGEPHFQKALQVVNSSSNAPEKGWKAFEDNQNRYWLIENTLNPRFKPFRGLIYKYHREGLDKMHNDMDAARASITTCIADLKKLRRDQPNSYLLTTFFSAKSDEIVNIYKQAFPDIKNRVAADLQEMDPGNATKYRTITGGN
ncbi:MAG: hypothetical protein ACI85F_001741 [Bacteroidia bacterium]|jgi:hypothetical protein